MKLMFYTVLLATLMSLGCPATPAAPNEPLLAVGQATSGSIDVEQTSQHVHYLKLGTLERKYFFIRASPYTPMRMTIGLYSNETRQLVHSCLDTVFDSCYVPSSKLKPDNTYAILIIAKESTQYILHTYWADLEHIKPNQQVKFMFEKQNSAQLFHLEFDGHTAFEQIRIILKPVTERAQGDTLRIFANKGFKQQPTPAKHDFASYHVWGDSEVIFLSKEELKGEEGISLFIVGNAETVYTLQSEFLTTTNHILKVDQTIHEYLPRERHTFYQMSFRDNANNTIDLFTIKLALFTGEIEVGFYYDKELTRSYEALPYQYMSDMQFKFDASFFNKTQEIFMKVRCPDSPATYQITAQARRKQVAFEITENVYEFSWLSDPKQAMYFFSHIWDYGQFKQPKLYHYDISLLKISGSPLIQFYLCKPTSKVEQCIKVNDNSFSQSAVKIRSTHYQVGSKVIYSLHINETLYRSLNSVEKQLMIIILITNAKDQLSVFAIEYSNPNKVRLLREGRAFEDKVKPQEKKHYKYLNNNPNVTQIRIHINEFSGLIKVRAKRTNILKEGGTQIPMEKDLPDTIVIRDNVTLPVYFQVLGVVTSLYTISVSAIHPQHVISSALVMAEDVEYEVKLLPYQHMSVQLHPIQANFVFEFYSEAGAIKACEIDMVGACEGKPLLGSHGQLNINVGTKREIRVKLDNSPYDTSNTQLARTELVRKVKLTLIYHAADMNHCDERRMNKVYSQTVNLGTCFKYHLPLANDIEIMSSRSDLGQSLQKYMVCKKKVSPSAINDRFIIKGDVVKEHCKDMANDMVLQVVVAGAEGQATKEVKMDYSVEYTNDIVTLTEGVAYTSRGYSTVETAMRTFFYEILDEDRDISIVLYNKRGRQYIYAKIISKPDRYTEIVNEAQSTISSKNSSYYQNPNIIIKPFDIAKVKCGRTCVLVISVYSQQKTGTEIEYSIEITQNHVLLKQNAIWKGFLSKSSAQFFEYECRSQTGTLIFKVSDNNRRCARSIMSKSPFPTGSNYFIKENQGVIIYEKEAKGTIYFAVEAIEDCPYSVSVSEESVNITKIEHGQFYDIKMDEGEEKWFYHRHVSNSSFKIMSLKEYGEIHIFANQSDLNKTVLKSLKNPNKMNRQKFSFKSEYMNTLAIDSSDRNFCVGCYYLICVYANRMTKTSIMISSNHTKLTLSENKIVFDQIKTINSVTTASFYRVSSGHLQVKVHSGKINFSMTYINQKYSKEFTKNKKVYHDTYNFTLNESIYKPIEIKIIALQVPALYSFALEPEEHPTFLTHRINPGEHTYTSLMNGETECLKGILVNKSQQVFITVDAEKRLSLQHLVVVVKLNNEQTKEYEKELVGNMMSIKFRPPSQAQNYSICLRTSSTSETLTLFAFQNQNVNLIHSNIEVLVRKQNRFVLYPKADIILDLFECKGSAEIYYGRTLENIRDRESHKLDIVGIPGQSHAIKIQASSPLYIDVVADMATVLWMPIDPNRERGIGYFKYAIGGLEYSTRFNKIDFKVGSVYNSKNTSTKPLLVKYTLFIANSKELLQEAVMCQRASSKKLLSAEVTTSKIGANHGYFMTITMDKKRITDQFSSEETLYFNVVADMILQPPNITDDDHQHYRFVYFQQVVPSEVLRQNRIQSMKLILLIILIVVALLGFGIVTLIFVRVLVPAIARLKSSLLIEEKEDAKEQSLPAPPTSERNQLPIEPARTDENLER